MTLSLSTSNSHYSLCLLSPPQLALSCHSFFLYTSLSALSFRARRVTMYVEVSSLPRRLFTCFQACLASTRQLFPEIPLNHNITFHTTDVDICDGQLAEIPKSTWDIVLPLLKSVTIKSEDPRIDQEPDGSDCNHTGALNSKWYFAC